MGGGGSKPAVNTRLADQKKITEDLRRTLFDFETNVFKRIEIKLKNVSDEFEQSVSKYKSIYKTYNDLSIILKRKLNVEEQLIILSAKNIRDEANSKLIETQIEYNEISQKMSNIIISIQQSILKEGDYGLIINTIDKIKIGTIIKQNEQKIKNNTELISNLRLAYQNSLDTLENNKTLVNNLRLSLESTVLPTQAEISSTDAKISTDATVSTDAKVSTDATVSTDAKISTDATVSTDAKVVNDNNIIISTPNDTISFNDIAKLNIKNLCSIINLDGASGNTLSSLKSTFSSAQSEISTLSPISIVSPVQSEIYTLSPISIVSPIQSEISTLSPTSKTGAEFFENTDNKNMKLFLLIILIIIIILLLINSNKKFI